MFFMDQCAFPFLYVFYTFLVSTILLPFKACSQYWNACLRELGDQKHNSSNSYINYTMSPLVSLGINLSMFLPLSHVSNEMFTSKL